MAWQTVPGLAGKLYTPEHLCRGKQQRCPDCFACQQCSPERCAVCVPATEAVPAKFKSPVTTASKEVIP